VQSNNDAMVINIIVKQNIMSDYRVARVGGDVVSLASKSQV